MSFDQADKLKRKTGLSFYDGDCYPYESNILDHFQYLLERIERLENKVQDLELNNKESE